MSERLLGLWKLSKIGSLDDERPVTNDQRQDAREKLIVALDVPSLQEATRLVEILAPEIVWFKVGSELFTSAGPHAVAMVRAHGGRVFLDLKFHDIPNTVAGAVAAACGLGVSMLNVHVAAGPTALRAAVETRNRGSGFGVRGSEIPEDGWSPIHESRITSHDPSRPLLIGVTLLTSHRESPEIVRQVVEAAVLAKQCGLDGVVASAREARAIKAACGAGFVVVTPGIRPAAANPADQGRVATPADALRAGADFLVVGRPVRTAPDPRTAVHSLLAEMQGVLRKD